MPAKLYKLLLIFGIAAIVAAVLLFWFYYQPSKNLEVDFLDVGQGDAILIKTPAGQTILIDGGPDDKVLRKLGENLAWWDKDIDLMILTHPHDDHVTGLIQVLKRYRVKQILYTGVVHTAPNYLAWLGAVRDRRNGHRLGGAGWAGQKINLLLADRPQTIELAAQCRIDVLYPRQSQLAKTVNNLNNSSIIISLVYGQTRFLFMGDGELEAENELIETKENLSAQVIKIGHHGSDTSSGEDFLNKVKPRIAVIEVGAGNDFGHPSGRVIKRLERLGAEIRRTDTDGTVKLASDGKDIRILGH